MTAEIELKLLPSLHIRAGRTLSGLLQVAVLFLTIVAVVALGIFAAYVAVNGILYAFAQSREQTSRGTMLIPTQTHASGD